jgi:putative addiction module component (TIGR02574 family)
LKNEPFAARQFLANTRLLVYHFNMSFTELLQELPALTVAERQILIRRVLELDDFPLSPHEEALIDERLAAHRRDPDSAVPLDEMKNRLRSRLDK